MTVGLLAVSFGYLVLTFAVLWVEGRRTRAGGPDPVTVFMVLFVLQCCVASVVIFGALPFVDRNHATGIAFIDNVFRASDLTVALGVFSLTAVFVVFFYVGCALGRLAMREPSGAIARKPLVLVVHPWRLWGILAVGAILTTVAFRLLGDTLVMRYANLILLRSDDLPLGRSVLNSNAFQLTQTWGWLAVIPLFTVAKRQGFGLFWWACLLAALGFAVMGVSRRALFLPILMAYLGIALGTRRWRLGVVVAAMGPMILWVAFGKDLISTLAYGGTIERALGVYDSWANGLLRAASDIGTTVVESMGTLALIDLPPRWGIDHLLSAAQRFPEGFFGVSVEWPERMVRISTRAFVGDWHQDVPPGMMGQMWLDFRLLGPLAWGLLFGVQMSVVQHYWERTAHTLEAAIVFVIVTFAVALPVNSGSFDFSFGMDIIALALSLYLCCSLRPSRPSAVPVDATEPSPS